MNLQLPRPQYERRLASMILGLAILTTLSACGSKSPAQQASDELNAGLQAQQAGNVDLATQHYKRCLELEPANKVCIFDLGTVAQSGGRLLEAESDYRLALLQDPDYTPALFNLAILRAQAGSTAEAIALYRHFVELLPNDAGGHLNLGLLLRATGDVTGAQAELDAAKRLTQARAIVELHATYSAVGGILPLPIASVAGITTIIIRMVKMLSSLYGVPFERDRARAIVAGLVGGATPTGFAAVTTSTLFYVVPSGLLLGTVVSAISAVACTRSIGRIFIEHFEGGATLNDFRAPTK